MSIHGRETSILQKCCVNHIPQIMLEMFCTSTQQCNYVVWTPIGTKVFLAERDDTCIELLLNYLHKFWDIASSDLELVWHEDVFGLKQKSIRFLTNSLITPAVLTHDDLKKFSHVGSDQPSEQKTVTQKCQGCKNDE